MSIVFLLRQLKVDKALLQNNVHFVENGHSTVYIMFLRYYIKMSWFKYFLRSGDCIL